MPAPRILATAALATLLSACQGLHPGPQSPVVALYRSAAEADAVAMGQFGAAPLALAHENEITPASQCAGTGTGTGRHYRQALCMRTADGQLGWLPSSEPDKRPGLPVSQLDNRV